MSQNTSALDTAESFNVTVDLIKQYAIFTLDLKGRITSWNEGAALIKGWRKDEVIGKYFGLLYPSDQQKAKRPQKNLERASVNGTYEEQGWRERKDGTPFFADVTISQIHDGATGQHIGYIKIVKDITKQREEKNEQTDANDLLKAEIARRKLTEKALKDSNTELDAFASAASHDLQEPLRMVISYLQLIDRRYRKKLDKDGKEFLEFALDGATRMKLLISDLVDYARIDTDKKPSRQTDLNLVLQHVLKNLSVSSGETGVSITYDRMPVVMGDEVQLGQLFQNLIANAIKFKGEADPRIHIGVEEKAAEYVFSVKDNGRGIAKKDFDKIFVIFKQLGNRTTRQGSGVGLALVRKIVTRHQGRLWVESEEGQGSTFYFTIPINGTNKKATL